jgi:serine protease
VTNLHGQFERLRGHITVGQRAGIVKPLPKPTDRKHGDKPAIGKAQACIEPNCNLGYNAGPVQHSPKVWVVFWGPNWPSDVNQTAVENYMLSFYSGLGASDDTWSQTTSQYSDGTGVPRFTAGVLTAAAFDASTPPAEVAPSDIAAEAVAAANFFKIADVPDAQVVVAAQSGTCFSDGFAGSSCQPVQSSYCGWHSATSYGSGHLSFTNFPYQLDAGAACGENFINAGSAGTLDGVSIIGGHEFAEAVTDPTPNSGYIDLSDNVSGGEIADKCIWGGVLWGSSDAAGNVTLKTGTYAMQSLWSNTVGGCVMSGRLPFSVSPLGNQTSALGHGVSVQVNASTTPPTPLAFVASGLPSGLSINPSTGQIQGTVGGPIKVYSPKVTVAYYDGSVSFSFKWTIDAVGAVTGPWAKCVDNFNARTVGGNKIDISTCNGKAQQRITYTPGGQLQVQTGCITGSTTAFFEPCSGATNKIWIRVGSEYVNKMTGKCLTDPNTSKVNGTQLAVAACVNGVNQRWTLP